MSTDTLENVQTQACVIRDLIDHTHLAMDALICAEDLRFELTDSERPPQEEEAQNMGVLRVVMLETAKENADEMLARIVVMNTLLAPQGQQPVIAESIVLMNTIRCRITKTQRFIQAVLNAEALNQRLVREGIAQDLSDDALHTFQAACTAVATTSKGLLADARTDLFLFCQKLAFAGGAGA